MSRPYVDGNAVNDSNICVVADPRFETIHGSVVDSLHRIHVWSGHLKSKLEGRGSYRGREFDIGMCMHRRCVLVDHEPNVLDRLRSLQQKHPNLTIEPVNHELVLTIYSV